MPDPTPTHVPTGFLDYAEAVELAERVVRWAESVLQSSGLADE